MSYAEKMMATRSLLKTINEVKTALVDGELDGDPTGHRLVLHREIAALGEKWFRNGFEACHQKLYDEALERRGVAKKIDVLFKKEIFPGQTRRINLISKVSKSSKCYKPL